MALDSRNSDEAQRETLAYKVNMMRSSQNKNGLILRFFCEAYWEFCNEILSSMSYKNNGMKWSSS
jgi:hypothetical protein